MFKDMPLADRPLNERYRVAGKDWARKKAVWNRYDKRKKITFNHMVVALQKLAIENGQRITRAQAELEVTVSDEWKQFIEELLTAEEHMDFAEVEKDSLKIEQWERNDESANAREERRSIRMGG